jgi:hypothetical protein
MKRFVLKGYLFASVLITPFLVQAVGVSQSGIDLATSTIQVDYTMSSLDDHGSLQCFGDSSVIDDTTRTASITNFLVDPSVNGLLSGGQIDISIIAAGDINCFQQAGDYDVTITLVDYVGNSTSQNFGLTVRAQEADQNNSTVSQIDCQEAFANNYDTCKLALTLRDQFNNILHSLANADVEVSASVDTDPWSDIALNCTESSGSGNDCDVDTNLKTSFFDAVRIKDGSAYEEVLTVGDTSFHEYSLLGSGRVGLDFRSMAPTIAADQREWQEEVTRLYPLSIKGPLLDETGDATGSTFSLALLEHAPLGFKTPVQLNINVEIGHKPDGENLVSIDAINDYENINNRPSGRYLIPCSAQRDSNFDLATYLGEDLDKDGSIDDDFVWYENGTATGSDLAVCPAFGVFDYTHQEVNYNNEGQYTEIKLLQNNDLRSTNASTPGCEANSKSVCLHNGATVLGSGSIRGRIHRAETISFNNDNPDGIESNNLDDTSNASQIFLPDGDYDDLMLYPIDGLSLFPANTIDDSSVDDFITESTTEIGTKDDLKNKDSDGNYSYRWRYFDEDTDPEFQLKTLVNYSFDDGGSSVPVAYYAGEYGFGSASCEEAIFRYSADCATYAANDPEFDILVTGDIIGEFLTYTDSTNLTDIGNNQSGGDLREQITKNAFVLSREIPADHLDSEGMIYSSDQEAAFANKFSSSGVYVVDGADLTIGSIGDSFELPSGKNTVIVKDGNLIIDSNLEYGNEQDSFGFIVICTNPEPYPVNCGNILLKPEVQLVVGTIFGDGAVMTSNGDKVIGSTINDDDYNNQLVIKGAVFTRNTIGGSKNSQSYFTPWENFDAFSQNINYGPLIAARYDWRAVRYPDSGIIPAPGETTRFNSVIIENDIGRTTQLTPPGFEVFGSVGR